MKFSDINVPDKLRIVSKKHFRIYSIVYEKHRDDVQALIYCEDLESTNGTYVNNILIGKIHQEKIGYLLNDGDVIEVRPKWKFRLHQKEKHSYLPCHQRTEIRVGREHKNTIVLQCLTRCRNSVTISRSTTVSWELASMVLCIWLTRLPH